MAIYKTRRVKSKYKGVSGKSNGGNIYWEIYYKGYVKRGFESEREAAKAYDILIISEGKEPVNILKRKI